MKKETLKVVRAAARKLQPVPAPRPHKDKKKYHRHEKHRTVHRNDAGLFFGFGCEGSGVPGVGRPGLKQVLQAG